MKAITDLCSACPQCGVSWKGKSFRELYVDEAQRLHLTAPDKLLDLLAARHLPETHQSLLVNIQGTDNYQCPQCNTQFIFEL
jgi:predicted RNA-binding Zn-ribbon protein involved in translation (DUF1610 family)